MFKCDDCESDTLLLYVLTEYGQAAKVIRDDGEYCKECFNRKFEENTNDKNK